jgi:hypothetical protein
MDGTLRVADPDALAVPDPKHLARCRSNHSHEADLRIRLELGVGLGKPGSCAKTWMNTIQQDQHAWEKVGKSWDWLAGCCEECGTGNSVLRYAEFSTWLECGLSEQQ